MNEKDANYFWLESGEDGTSIRMMTKHQVAAALRDDLSDGIDHEFLTRVPENDKGCWYGVSENAVLLIKGELVVPTPKQVVQQYEVP